MLTEQQLKDRRKGIGGSDMGILMGCSEDDSMAYSGGSLVKLYLSKVDPDYKSGVNNAMSVGNIIEEFIIKMFEAEYGWSVVRENQTRQSKTNPIMMANIDGYIPTVDAVLEVKNVDPSKQYMWGKEDSDEIPETYLYQCAHYAHVYNVQKVYLAAYFGGARFKVYLYERNMDLEKIMIERAEKFWNDHVVPKIPPVPSSYSDCTLLHQQSQAESCAVADEVIKSSIDELVYLQSQIKDMETKAEDLKTAICSSMAANEILTTIDGNKLATWKTQTANRIDTTKLKKDYPEIAKELTKESTSRVFRIAK